jgi:hypothetical protein
MKAHSVPAFTVEQIMTTTPYSGIIASPCGENVANDNRELIGVKVFLSFFYSILRQY